MLVEAQALGVPLVTTRAGGSVAWLHAAGPQLRPALQALQSRDLLAQCGVLRRERGDLLEQLDDQLPQLVEAKIIDIWWRSAHAASESQP